MGGHGGVVTSAARSCDSARMQKGTRGKRDGKERDRLAGNRDHGERADMKSGTKERIGESKCPEIRKKKPGIMGILAENYSH